MYSKEENLHLITEASGWTQIPCFEVALLDDKPLESCFGNNGMPVDWLRFLQESTPKLQGVWSKQISKNCSKELLTAMSEPDAADARSHGGPGASTFLLPTTEEVRPMPDRHFLVALRDRLLLPACPT